MSASQGWGNIGKELFKLELPEIVPSNNELRGMNRFAYQSLREKWRDMVAVSLGAKLPPKPAKANREEGREEWRSLVYAALEGIRPAKAYDMTSIAVRRHSPGELDWDNAYGGLKPILDCLVMPSKRNPDGLGFIKDDNPRSMPLPPYVEQCQGKRGAGKTEIVVYETTKDVARPQVFTGEPTYRIEIPLETPSNNVIKGMHFKDYKALRKRWQYEIIVAHGGRRPKAPLKVAGVAINRYSSGQLDWDNAYGGLKPLLDCLVYVSNRNPNGLGFILDDNPTQMPIPPYLQQLRAQAEAGKTEILIYALEEKAL
jgi:hypothetical protein